MDDCTDLSLKMLGKSIKSIPLLIKGILINCLMSYIINFGIFDRMSYIIFDKMSYISPYLY